MRWFRRRPPPRVDSFLLTYHEVVVGRCRDRVVQELLKERKIGLQLEKIVPVDDEHAVVLAALIEQHRHCAGRLGHISMLLLDHQFPTALH